MKRAALLAVALMGALASGASAQLENCDLEYSAYTEQTDLGGGRTLIRAAGPMAFSCPDGTRITADNGLSYQPEGERRFVGNVVYRDSTQTLTTDLLIAYGNQDRMVARGSVVFTDLTTGSTIRGTEMERFTRTFPAGEERTVVRGRPHAVFHRERPAPGDTAAPLVMDADSMIIRGRSHFTGAGAVQFERGELSGLGAVVTMDDAAGTLEILGSRAAGKPGNPLPATLNTERFSLTADMIVGQLEGEEIRQLTATREAFLDGETARIRAPQLNLFFEDSQLNRLVGSVRVAGGDIAEAPTEEVPDTPRRGRVLEAPREGPPLPARRLPERVVEERLAAAEQPAEEEERPRVVATAEGLRIVADSLEILAPAEVVEQLTAVGDALGERLPADSVGEAAEDVPEVLAREWIRGDTIVGWFAEQPPATPADTAQRVLERLMAVAGARPASSLNRMAPPEGADAPNYNYLKEARRITIHLEAGQVVDVVTEGPVVGVYLTREERRAEPPAQAAPPPGEEGRR